MVIVFKRGISGMDALLGKAGLQFLAASGREAIAAFSSDPEMITFLHHLQLYGRGTATQKTPHQQQLFGAIHKVRPLTPEDVLDPDVRQAAAHRGPDELLRVDLQCWCPEDEPDARRRFADTVQAIQTAGGTVVDRSFRYPSGLSLIRADVPAGAVVTLARTDRVRSISLLPRPLLSTPDMVRAQASTFPPVLAVSPDAPIVAVLATDVGTSFAAPLVSHAALRVLGRYPGLSANAVRAVLLRQPRKPGRLWTVGLRLSSCVPSCG
jgi:hypothetical protein